MGRPGGPDFDTDVAVEDSVTSRVDYRKKYAVLLHNDDYTTMECVVEVLEKFFHKNQDEAMQVMLQVHHQGKGIAGIYNHEIAETKSLQAMEHARSKGYPLQCTVEPLEGT
jgi:ATP-dependent Clp protease adaptor protein ClpS